MNKPVLFAATLLIVVALTALTHGQNWPSFRGPNASGVADAHPLPISWAVVVDRGVNS